MAISNLSAADLGSRHSDAVRGERAAIEVDDDLYVAACKVTKAYRDEISRRTLEGATDQAALDALNAGLRGLSIAEIQAERS